MMKIKRLVSVCTMTVMLACCGFSASARELFTDVPESDPYVGYFALAYGAGFAVPNKDGGIDPDSLVSRGMILYMLYNSLK